MRRRLILRTGNISSTSHLDKLYSASLASTKPSAPAKKVRHQIDFSVNEIRIGSDEADDVGRTSAEVRLEIERVDDVISEITGASEEQRRGIEQVNQAVGHIDEVTQQNTALVEQATSLDHTASLFKVETVRATETLSRW